MRLRRNMRVWLFRASVVMALASAAAACGNPGTSASLTVEDSVYTLSAWSVAPGYESVEAVRGYPSTTPRTLSFDRTTRTVTIRYMRDGHAVVETWDVVAE
jgi:hypothetical protein